MSYFVKKETEYMLKALLDTGFSNTQAAVIFTIIEKVADELTGEIENLQKEIDDNEQKISAIDTRLDNV